MPRKLKTLFFFTALVFLCASCISDCTECESASVTITYCADEFSTNAEYEALIDLQRATGANCSAK